MQLAVEANERFLNTAAPTGSSRLGFTPRLSGRSRVSAGAEIPCFAEGLARCDLACSMPAAATLLPVEAARVSFRKSDISASTSHRSSSPSRLAGTRHCCDHERLTKYAPNHRFDLIVMRFFVQHLKDFGAILQAADRLLARLDGF